MDQFVLRKPADGQIVLTCRGDLDLLTRAALGAALHDALGPARRALVVDLDAVEFIDCGSVRLLAQAASLQAGQGGDFLVVCSSDFLRRVLRLTGFSDHWAVVTELPADRTPADRPDRVSSRVPARPSVRRASR